MIRKRYQFAQILVQISKKVDFRSNILYYLRTPEMVNSKNIEEVDGVVEEALPNTLFRVRLEKDEQILAYLAGRMRMYRIKVLVGDKVRLVLDPYGGKGRIVKRL